MKPYLVFSLISLIACSSSDNEIQATAERIQKTLSFNGVEVEAVIQFPPQKEVDVLLVFRGTLRNDNRIIEGAHTALDRFSAILNRQDMLLVSVAYPEENLLFGDNITHAEAALLWVKNEASQELDVQINRIFLAGHSQGGYLVTRLNTMHATDGVIANAPGPLNLLFRCQLEENNQVPAEMECDLLRETYGTTSENPEAYLDRSLLRFTQNHLSPILFVQGLNDSPIQMHSWPVFKHQLEACTTCNNIQFLEIPNQGHTAMFQHLSGREAFNLFLE